MSYIGRQQWKRSMYDNQCRWILLRGSRQKRYGIRDNLTLRQKPYLTVQT
jgi:hypothetical protein